MNAPSTITTIIVPFGEALVSVFVTSTCDEAEWLRSTLSGPVLVVCKCRLGRLLLAAAEPAEAGMVEQFSLLLNPAADQ